MLIIFDIIKFKFILDEICTLLTQIFVEIHKSIYTIKKMCLIFLEIPGYGK